MKKQRYPSSTFILKNTSNCKRILGPVHKGTWCRFVEAVQLYAKQDFDESLNGLFIIKYQRRILAAKSRIFYNTVKAVLPFLRQDAKIYEEKQVYYDLALTFVENYSMRGITFLARKKIAEYHDGGTDTWR